MATTPSPITQRENTAKPTLGETSTQHPQLIIAEMKWSVLPQALQNAIGEQESVWVDHDHLSYFGITISRSDNPDATFDLKAWVIVENNHNTKPEINNTRRTILQYNGIEVHEQKSRNTTTTGPRFNRTPPPAHFSPTVASTEKAAFHLLNGRPDRLSIDVISESGIVVCRLTYVIRPDEKKMWWAQSILPQLLNLQGGQYELKQVNVNILAND